MTPAVRLLKQKKIEFKLHQYTADPSIESYGEAAADALQIEIKTRDLISLTDSQLADIAR